MEIQKFNLKIAWKFILNIFLSVSVKSYRILRVILGQDPILDFFSITASTSCFLAMGVEIIRLQNYLIIHSGHTSSRNCLYTDNNINITNI